ncbi:MAG: bifunctional proline dehydrogenase/L-glutamate gamma-semialdehyde dehydrogenase [Gammaproteobacteria bacterium RIFCSPHIGHO2_12_FULL_37_34]|nr:MAG: bifunctional proline dehydrogenase/L-glutamate gamma-semialdehyde dehydrogenase [Gammaproteobacteria bacterium RIFCSPHIGHO2_12_FULL_37_34]
MLTTIRPSHPLRDIITNAYRMDETTCIQHLIQQAKLPEATLAQIEIIAKELLIGARKNKKISKLNTLLLQYDLSTDEGIALMCLAEALLRIPDTATQNKFIADKIATIHWKNQLGRTSSLFANVATWSLLLSGKIYKPQLNEQKKWLDSLKRATSRIGVVMVRPLILQVMKMIGEEFIIGQDIQSALKRAPELEKLGYHFSFDMLGEAARTAEDAKRYVAAYTKAIEVIGQTYKLHSVEKNNSISVKLSALHPRYEYTQQERILKELPPLLLALAEKAKQHSIQLIIDAEETDRLDLSLDIFEIVFTHPALALWDGLGLAIQAYQKRAFYVIDWLADLAKRASKKITVRLVKGAYWDAEIKNTQIHGFHTYPVFTRKNSTDVSYIACAKKLLSQSEQFYSQFGTHNAYSIASVLEIAKITGSQDNYEFQCLHGMGRPLYDQLLSQTNFKPICRIYAPVGTYHDLLGYLVRRILENGANSSFLHQLSDETIPIEKIVFNPVARIATIESKPHPYIPLPKYIYKDWLNSEGLDLSHANELQTLKKQMEKNQKQIWQAGSLINGQIPISKDSKFILSPYDLSRIGKTSDANETDIEKTLTIATHATTSWAAVPVIERAKILERAAEYFQCDMPMLITLLAEEGGKCILDCIAEIRETIDYCRYYAYRAQLDFTPMRLPGPTGEQNTLSLHPRGVIACISPWNFPLAIFTGQIVAALVTGNVVIAKPAQQTPFIAYQAIQILHQAGIPKDVLQLLIGEGSIIGAKLVADPRIAGVMFTGSTATAKIIERSLANRLGPIALFIAETGGQNAMIVDSSALPEQTVIDIAQSAFNSAGQRCSALRVLFVQDDCAPTLLEMLKGYMAELTIGDPRLLATDIGPVIDENALHMLKNHFAKMNQQATLLAQVPLRQTPPGYYFAPCVFEINHLSLLEGEIFGPILHVIRYRSTELTKIMQNIIDTGYGLTLGVHSRIDSVVESIIDRMPVGNRYVNRNMIGAVVGVQPFGGERLSGTGPKAGGPHYLPRLCIERSTSVNTTAVGGNTHLISLLEEN